jgi:hypothetical protein
MENLRKAVKKLMSYPLGAKLGKHKHIILLAVTLVALGAYLLPSSTVFAGQNNNNDIGNSANPITDSKTKAEGGIHPPQARARACTRDFGTEIMPSLGGRVTTET